MNKQWLLLLALAFTIMSLVEFIFARELQIDGAMYATQTAQASVAGATQTSTYLIVKCTNLYPDNADTDKWKACIAGK